VKLEVRLRPRTRDFIGAGILAAVLFALVALIFFGAVANADPAALHSAALARPSVA
jgi:hypothetical protein